MFNPLGTLFGKVMSGVAVVLLIVIGVQAYDNQRLRTVIERLTGQNKALRLDLDRVREMTELADRKAREAKAAAEAEYKRKAEKTDAEYKTALADARSRADAYARRMRVQAPPGAASGTPAAPNGNAPQGSDGPGEAPYVAVTRDDFDRLNENTVRLQEARKWACSLDNARCD